MTQWKKRILWVLMVGVVTIGAFLFDPAGAASPIAYAAGQGTAVSEETDLNREPGVAGIASLFLRSNVLANVNLSAWLDSAEDASDPRLLLESRGDSEASDVGELAAEVDRIEKATVVIAASDFQYPFPKGTASDNASERQDANAKAVTRILERIHEDYETAQGFLFAGDYNYTYPDDNLKAFMKVLKQTVRSVFDYDQEVYIQGNHEHELPSDKKTGLAKSGNNDTKDYGVYVINERDYSWKNNSSEADVKKTAKKLKTYLDKKLDARYTKPIFVISHVPLHISLRSKQGDCKYARYIFDVLQSAGEQGLNVIFLFGHNHAHGWDNYLGGASVYLGIGDKINIAKTGSKTKYTREKLNFTYMNAGYTGYYTEFTVQADLWDDDEQGFLNFTGVDDCLTMTVFEITDNKVKISRYSEDGLHELKSAGTYNVEKGKEPWKSETKVVKGSVTVQLNQMLKSRNKKTRKNWTKQG